MKNLSNQQLILLSLLVSLVASAATSVVIISLDGQTAGSVTNTIERVIQQGVAEAVPGSSPAAVNQAVSSGQNGLANAVAQIGKSVVFVGDDSGTVSGLGVVVNSRGTVMTDKAALAGTKDPSLTYQGGAVYQAAVVQSQVNGDIVFLDPLDVSATSTAAFSPTVIGSSPAVGQIAASLGGSDAGTLRLGIIDELVDGSSSAPVAISTTIASSGLLVGSPLFDAGGDLLGLKTSSLSSATGTEFYPVSLVQAAIPK